MYYNNCKCDIYYKLVLIYIYRYLGESYCQLHPVHTSLRRVHIFHFAVYNKLIIIITEALRLYWAWRRREYILWGLTEPYPPSVIRLRWNPYTICHPHGMKVLRGVIQTNYKTIIKTSCSCIYIRNISNINNCRERHNNWDGCSIFQ